jgi:hypothetical protein
MMEEREEEKEALAKDPTKQQVMTEEVIVAQVCTPEREQFTFQINLTGPLLIRPFFSFWLDSTQLARYYRPLHIA